MCHQVSIRSPDSNTFRFLWRKDTDTEIEDYTMRVHIFGKTNLPGTDNWALKQMAPEDDH